MKISIIKRSAIALVIAALSVSATSCAKGGTSGGGGGGGGQSGGGGTLTMWTHNAGNKTELASITAIVTTTTRARASTRSDPGLPAGLLQPVGRGGRGEKKLPCILDIDGPNVPNWAWAGYLAPLEGIDDTLSKYLP